MAGRGAGRRREPSTSGRCPTSGMTSISAELAEAQPVAGVTAARNPLGTDDPDAELVSRWQAGDASAFEALVRRHERRVFRLLLRMLGTREEAEDAAQEAFLSLHRHGHHFRGEARFSTFIYRVAANAALNRGTVSPK